MDGFSILHESNGLIDALAEDGLVYDPNTKHSEEMTRMLSGCLFAWDFKCGSGVNFLSVVGKVSDYFEAQGIYPTDDPYIRGRHAVIRFPQVNVGIACAGHICVILARVHA